MKRRWLFTLVVLASTATAAPAVAQPDDDPYAPAPTAAAQPAAQPARPVAPPVARPPAPQPTHAPAPPPPAPIDAVEPESRPVAEPHAAPLPVEVHEAEPHREIGHTTAQPTAAVHGAPPVHGDAHGGEHAAASGHGDAHGGGHDAHALQDMNWIYGFFGKLDEGSEEEPSLLWRKPDMPPPFLANLINFAVFLYVVVRFGKKPLQEALTNRKKTIMKDIDAAAKMKDEAEKRLAQYENKLQHIDDEVERIRKEFREQGERDKERILEEAREKRERMIKDARFLIEQEAKQMRITLMQETVEVAMKAAEEILQAKLSASDHERVAEDFLGEIPAAGKYGFTKGGAA
jgi:F-type H+-transporting ATPase subunit b